MSSSTLGRSIRLFLVDGSPTGLITAEIINWTGHALSAPYSRLRDLSERSEALRSGIYFLVGDDPTDPTRQRIYIGESENIKKRLQQHDRSDSKDFAEAICIFTSKDPHLTKGHLRYLESRLIETARSAGRAEVDNATTPPPPSLPEADIADMEYFLAQVSVVLPVLNYHFLRSTRPLVIPAPATSSSNRAIKLVLKPATASSPLASAIYSDSDFVVLRDSIVRPDSPTSTNVYRGKRQALIESGRLVRRQGADDYVFIEDTPFPSPSAAAAVILDRNANGRTEWRTEDLGKTLKELQEEALGPIVEDE